LRILRILGASVVLGVVLAAASRGLMGQQHVFAGLAVGHFKELALAATAAAALPLYGALLFVSGGVTPAELKSALRRRR
jgi:hypothetical protein